MEIRLRLALGVIAAMLGTDSRAQAIDVSPQWQHTLEFEARAMDTISLGRAPSWALLPDGDVVVATRVDNTTLLLRRVAPDGAVRHAARASVPWLSSNNPTLVVRTDAASGDILVMAGSDLSCGLQRFDGNFARRWSITLPAHPQISTCMDLAVGDGGAVIALQFGGLSRIAADGSVAWSVLNGDDGYYLAGHAMTLGNDGTIWVAGRGDLIANGADHVAVQRFAPTGTRLPADTLACSGCVASSPGGIVRTPDGDVVVVGLGSGAQGAFVLRYAPDGSRLYFAQHPAPGYRNVVMDDGGGLYAWASPDTMSGEVRHLDADDGAVVWSRPARDITGSSDGVVVTQADETPDAAIAAVGFNAAGVEQWRHTLPGATSGSEMSRGLRVDNRVTWLAQGILTGNIPCPASVRLVSAEIVNGSPTEAAFCAMPAEARVVAQDALDGVGSLVATEHHLIAFMPDGRERWRAETCAMCAPQSAGYSSWVDVVLRADGGAWAIESAREESGTLSPLTLSVRRIGADGTLLQAHSLGSTWLGPDSLNLERAADEGIVVLESSTFDSGSAQVRYTRLDGEGSLVGQGSYPMPDSQTMLRSARVLTDGSVVFVSEGVIFCDVVCYPVQVGITRVEASGVPMWNYWFPQSLDPPAVGLEPDGSANAVLPLPPSYLTHRRAINPEGIAAADVPVPAMVPGAWLQELSPLVDDRQTVVFMSSSAYGVALLDALGHITATRSIYPHNYWPQVASSPHGFLTTDSVLRDADAELLSASDLQTLVRFRLAGSALPTSTHGAYVYGRWSMPGDGSVYGATTVFDANGARQLALARFNVPGSSADRIFAHGFESD